MRTAPQSSQYAIRRSDGSLYAGTAERKARFTKLATCVARFGTIEQASTRMEGLRKDESNDRTFLVVPIERVSRGR